MYEKFEELLRSLGYYDIEFDYEEDGSYHFEAVADAPVLVRVDDKGNGKVWVYYSYYTDKHYTYEGEFDISK